MAGTSQVIYWVIASAGTIAKIVIDINEKKHLVRKVIQAVLVAAAISIFAYLIDVRYRIGDKIDKWISGTEVPKPDSVGQAAPASSATDQGRTNEDKPAVPVPKPPQMTKEDLEECIKNLSCRMRPEEKEKMKDKIRNYFTPHAIIYTIINGDTTHREPLDAYLNDWCNTPENVTKQMSICVPDRFDSNNKSDKLYVKEEYIQNN